MNAKKQLMAYMFSCMAMLTAANHMHAITVPLLLEADSLNVTKCSDSGEDECNRSYRSEKKGFFKKHLSSDTTERVTLCAWSAANKKCAATQYALEACQDWRLPGCEDALVRSKELIDVINGAPSSQEVLENIRKQRVSIRLAEAVQQKIARDKAKVQAEKDAMVQSLTAKGWTPEEIQVYMDIYAAQDKRHRLQVPDQPENHVYESDFYASNLPHGWDEDRKRQSVCRGLQRYEIGKELSTHVINRFYTPQALDQWCNSSDSPHAITHSVWTYSNTPGECCKRVLNDESDLPPDLSPDILALIQKIKLGEPISPLDKVLDRITINYLWELSLVVSTPLTTFATQNALNNFCNQTYMPKRGKKYVWAKSYCQLIDQEASEFLDPETAQLLAEIRKNRYTVPEAFSCEAFHKITGGDQDAQNPLSIQSIETLIGINGLNKWCAKNNNDTNMQWDGRAQNCCSQKPIEAPITRPAVTPKYREPFVLPSQPPAAKKPEPAKEKPTYQSSVTGQRASISNCPSGYPYGVVSNFTGLRYCCASRSQLLPIARGQYEGRSCVYQSNRTK